MSKNWGATILFTLPPSANSCWRNVNGRTILSAKYRAWKEENKPIGTEKVFCPNYPVAITIIVRPGKKWRKCDLDNRVKPILDQLKNCKYLIDDNCDYVKSITIALGEKVSKDFESYVEIDMTKFGDVFV
jgi:crossover junction endodeoxyribonuclease RusA